MSVLSESAIVLASAVIALPFFKRLGFGTVLGYLAAGIVIGPHILGLVTDVERLQHISEMGVVFLLFIIGLELQPRRLWALRKPVFGSGGAQIVLTTVALGAVGYAFGLPPQAALIAAFGLAMSSTAFAIQSLAEKKQLTTQHGRAAFSILLFQDVAVIPALAFVPLLAGDNSFSLSLEAARAAAVIAAVIVGGRLLLKPFFRVMARADSPELFTAAALLVVLSTAFFMDMAGLSMTLGSFLAGMLLADSEYRHELEATMEPFKGLLLGLFFIAVGMSVDLALLLKQPLLVFGLALGLLTIKGALLFGIGRWTGLPTVGARHLAVYLSQGGEFAFVLYEIAGDHHLIPRDTGHLLVAVVTLSMALTPVLIKLSEMLCRTAPPPEENYDTIDEKDSEVIMAGFGRMGQIVARVLHLRKIPFTALDKNFEHVDFVRKFGGKVYFGDASRLDLLRAVHAERAKLFVLVVDDVESSLRIAELVRRHYPHLKIYARARNRQHVYQLREIGVHVVIREQFHSSLEMSRQLLIDFGAKPDEAEMLMDRFRAHDEKMLARQQQFHHDEARLIESAKQSLAELEDLFEQDESMQDRNGTAKSKGAAQQAAPPLSATLKDSEA